MRVLCQLAAASLLLLAAPTGGAGETNTDLYGDPLPNGAIMRLGTARFRQGFGIESLAFSPDGKAIVSGGGDRTVRLWDVETGREIRRLREIPYTDCSGWGMFVAFSPDGKFVASACQHTEPSIHITDVDSGQELYELPLPARPSMMRGPKALIYSRDGKMLAAGDIWRSRVLVWDIATKKMLLEKETRSPHAVSFSTDGKLLASAGEDKAIHVHDIASCAEIATYDKHEREARCVAFLPDGHIASFGQAQLRIWDPLTEKTSRLIAVAGAYSPVARMSVGPDGKRAAVSAQDKLYLFDLTTGAQLWKVERRYINILAVAISPDGKYVATGDADGTIRIHDAATGQVRKGPVAHDQGVEAVAFSRDGAWMATGGRDLQAIIWDRATGVAKAHVGGFEFHARAVAFSPDGKTVACSNNRSIRMLDVLTGKVTGSLDNKHRDAVTCLSFSRDGTQLISASHVGELRITDLATGNAVFELRPFEHFATLAVLSPDGTTLTASDGWTAGVAARWQVADKKEIFRIERPGLNFYASALSADGRFLAGGASTGEVRIWDLSVDCVDEIVKIKPHHGNVEAAAFSPDGHLLATGDLNGKICLTEAATGLLVLEIGDLRATVRGLAFSPDGRTLAAALGNSSALLWNWPRLVTGEASKPISLEELWGKLSSTDDGRTAIDAVLRLAAWGDNAVAFLAQRLRPISSEEHQTLIKNLDDDDFAVRSKAATELVDLAAEIGSLKATLRKLAQRTDISEEARTRAKRIVASISDAVPVARWRNSRAVLALTWIGTPEARALLVTLANGASEANQTKCARQALLELGVTVK